MKVLKADIIFQNKSKIQKDKYYNPVILILILILAVMAFILVGFYTNPYIESYLDFILPPVLSVIFLILFITTLSVNRKYKRESASIRRKYESLSDEEKRVFTEDLKEMKLKNGIYFGRYHLFYCRDNCFQLLDFISYKEIIWGYVEYTAFPFCFTIGRRFSLTFKKEEIHKIYLHTRAKVTHIISGNQMNQYYKVFYEYIKKKAPQAVYGYWSEYETLYKNNVNYFIQVVLEEQGRKGLPYDLEQNSVPKRNTMLDLLICIAGSFVMIGIVIALCLLVMDLKHLIDR